MKILTSVALLFLFISPAAFAEPELRGSPTELTQYLKDIPKTVSVVGSAEVKVQADKAVVSLSVRTEDKLLATALRANQKLRADVTATLEQHGIKVDQIKASQFSQTPKYGWLSGDKAKSYVVENTIKVTVHSEKEFQAVAAVVDSVNEARYLGVDYEQADKGVYKTKALSEACDKATEKKKLLEDKFGFKLVAQKINEGVTVSAPAGAGERYGVSSYYGSEKRGASASNVNTDVGEAGVGGEASFGEVVYKAEVTVEYRVEK